MLVESFLEYLQYEKNYSFHTVEGYRNDLFQFKQFVCGDEMFNPGEVDAIIIRRWIVFLMDENYSPLSVNRKLSSLKSFFKYLCRYNYIETSPVKKIAGPKTSKPLPSFIKETEMDIFFSSMDGDCSFDGLRDKAILDVFYTTGVRRSELIGLKDADIDFNAGLIKVTGKRNKQRLIPFSDKLKETMLLYLSGRQEEVGLVADGHFFVCKNGRPLSNSVVYRIVKKRLSEIPNLSKRSPHLLRHTFATSMLNSGADLNAVKELLGHASLSSTEVYTHTTFEELKKMYHQAHPRA